MSDSLSTQDIIDRVNEQVFILYSEFFGKARQLDIYFKKKDGVELFYIPTDSYGYGGILTTDPQRCIKQYVEDYVRSENEAGNHVDEEERLSVEEPLYFAMKTIRSIWKSEKAIRDNKR